MFTYTPNSTFLRHQFRKLTQISTENVSQYVARLRKASEGCGFADINVEIVDQVIAGCSSADFRSKLLGKGETLDLPRLLDIAANYEAVQIQAKEMKAGPAVNVSSVNKIQSKSQSSGSKQKSQKSKSEKSDVECYRCGNKGHVGSSTSCPARGKVCRRCNLKDHFEKKCRTKPKSGKDNKANCVETNEDESQYAFTCKTSKKFHRVDVELGGVSANFIIDSGSDCNILSAESWKSLKRGGISCESSKQTKTIFPYGSEVPLKVIGTFVANAKIGENSTKAEFVVVDHDVESLLGYETSETLGTLKIGVPANVNMCSSYQAKYPNLFKGVGLLKNRTIRLTIDNSVTPVCQPCRRIPFGLRDKVEQKIHELVKSDIIEPVSEVSDWVSPVVVVPKPNSDIRLCVDMRQANTAIKRERHPIPTVDELLLDMSKSNIFSKLDLKWGFHQIMLHEKSRHITTFATHMGLYRYKRLMFGINAAPELYQNEIRKIIQGIPGVANMSDDLIVHGSTTEEHDTRLNTVLKRLEECGLTLNPEKCLFGVEEVEFLGHRLTCKGIEPGVGKVEAVLGFREPKDQSEVRSFLGLVEYLGRFIPNLSDLCEPLRKLRRKSEPFVFGAEQAKAFSELKNVLSDHKTLGYFDVTAHTSVIADASPVALGAVLVQNQGGVNKVIYYANRSLSDVERRYSQTEKESLALVWACEKFQSYLLGIDFDLITDHQPLLKIYSPKSKPSARIERWVLRLQPYNFRVVYVKGKNNIADPLSRLLEAKTGKILSKTQLEDMAYVRFVAQSATPSAVTTS